MKSDFYFIVFRTDREKFHCSSYFSREDAAERERDAKFLPGMEVVDENGVLLKILESKVLKVKGTSPENALDKMKARRSVFDIQAK